MEPISALTQMLYYCRVNGGSTRTAADNHTLIMVLQFFLLVENMAFVSFFHTDALKLGKDSHGEETGAQLTSCSLFLFLYFTYYQELAESID